MSSVDHRLLAAADDVEAFDAAVLALPSVGALLPGLLAAVPEAVRARSAGLLSARTPFDVRAVNQLGRHGFWLATEHVLARLPALRRVPSPTHERWDALVEIHRERPEATWLVAHLIASMDRAQARLADRALLGVDRRFGERGRRAIEHAMKGAPLEEHVAAWLARPPGR